MKRALHIFTIYTFWGVLSIFIIGGLTGCGLEPVRNPSTTDNSGNTTVEENQAEENVEAIINTSGITLADRFKVPDGYERTEVATGSFGEYLRNLPLKPHGTKVTYYNGGTKFREVYEAVIDMEIGDRDLQQCADAVIRLRAEYLYQQQEYEQIHFNFTNGFKAEYTKWRQGYRLSVRGNQVSWISGNSSESQSYASFRKYLDTVFAYAGTLSLSQELTAKDLADMNIGDVFIQGGSPGHCVIVVDMAIHNETGEKLFMLAQSYMPAQDIHILKNQQNEESSPWYFLNFAGTLKTPEWTFEREDLKQFNKDS